MLRSACLILIGLTAAGAVPSVCAAAPVGTAWPKLVLDAPAVPFKDPFPLRRVRVSESQLAGLLKAADNGPLVRLPRDEFEARVRKAAEAVREARAAVRLLEAKYKAELRDTNLVGTAEWVLVNPNPRPVAFALEPLRLVVKSARWADGSPAVLGLLGPGFPAGPAVWVGSGRQVLTFEWSVMGTAEPGERHFELRAPPCPASALELDLPADRVPVAGGPDVLLTGPFAAGKAGRSLWRFRFSVHSKLDVAVRTTSNGSTSRDPVRASLLARYDVEPGQTKCSFEYDLEPARGSVAEWVFDVDPGVRITDAVVSDRASWHTEPPATPGGPSGLRVRLRQPGPGGKVLITALAPPPPANPEMPLPGVRPRNGRVGEERVNVRLAPDLKPGGWSPGDFRLLDAAPAADKSLSLAFAGSLLPANANQPFRRLPGVAAAGVTPEYQTRESLEWGVESGRALLTATVTVRVRRGPLFYLPFQLPAGYSLIRLGSLPEEAVAFSGLAGGAPPTVLVEFQKPIAAEQEVELRLELRGPPIPAAATVRVEAPAKMPIPRLVPVGATERDGVLTVGVVPGWRVTPQVTGSPEAPPTDSATIFPYRGREPDGVLYLAPRQPDWTSTSDTFVSRSDGRLVATTRFDLRIHAGSVSSLVVLAPEAEGRERTWRVLSTDNALANATAMPLGELPHLLPLLAGANAGLTSVVAAAPLLDGPLTAWRLTFTKAASGDLSLETVAPLPTTRPPPVAQRFVPLLTVVDCPTQNAAVQLDTGVAADFRFPPPDRDRLVRRDTRRPSRVPLHPTTRLADAPAGGWQFEALYQVSRFDGTNELAVAFGGRLLSAGGPSLDIGLPRGAVPEAAVVAGRWVSPQADVVSVTDAAVTLRLPVPAGGPVPFEVRYRLPTATHAGFAKPLSPRPQLPGEPEGCLRTWLLGPNVATLWPLQRATHHDTADVNAALLTGPLGEAPDRLTNWDEGSHDAAALVAVRRPVLEGAQFLLAAAILAAGWWIASRPQRPTGRAVLLAAMLLALGGVAALFAWGEILKGPLATGAVVFAFLVIARAKPTGSESAGLEDAKREPRESSNLAFGSAVVLVLAALFLPRAAHGDAAEADVVYILTASEGETVLAPRAVLDRLDSLARPAVPTVVVTDAVYEGQADDSTARVTARYEVRNLSASPAVLALPLGDVRLESVRVGTTPAFPVAAASDLYTITIPAAGTHTVTAVFAVPVRSQGGEREVRFGIPEVLSSRLTLLVPREARQVILSGWHGNQSTEALETGTRLAADIGDGKSLQVRWRQGLGPATNASVKVKEAAIWAVSEAEAELTACYLLRIEQGTAGTFRFDLPAGIDLTRVVVRSPEAPAGSAAVLRDWTVGAERAGVRQLRLQLQTPVEGRVLVILEGVPRQPLARQPVLRFPRIAGAVQVESSAFAFRSDRVAVDSLAVVGLTDAAPDALTRDFAGVSHLTFNPAAPPRVFRPAAGTPPELRPTLRPAAALPAATQDVTWSLTASRRADAAGWIRWTRKDEPLTAVEFDLPPAVQVQEIRGPEIGGWSVSPAGRVQVWFRTPQKEPSIEWTGTMPLGPSAKPPDPLTFDPPLPRPVGVGSLATTLHVRPPDGWGVRVDRERGWAALPAAGHEWAFHAEGLAALPPHWTLYAVRASLPPVAGIGSVEVQPTGVVYRAVRQQNLVRGRPHHLVLRVSSLPAGAVVEPEFPPGLRISANAEGSAMREWDLDVPAGTAEPIRVAVAVRTALPNAELVVPMVSLDIGGGPPGVPQPTAWFVLGGAASTNWRLRGAAAVPTKWDEAQKAWPKDVERFRQSGATLWAPRSPTVIVRLMPLFKPGGAAPAPTVGAAPPVAVEAVPSVPPVPPVAPPSEVPAWRAPLPEAVIWCAGLALLAALASRFPRSTWPEQLALLTGLLALLLGGNPVLALLVLGTLRLGWLIARRHRVASLTA